jgi:membrane protein implicated in regulation of membrane protease activity
MEFTNSELFIVVFALSVYRAIIDLFANNPFYRYLVNLNAGDSAGTVLSVGGTLLVNVAVNFVTFLLVVMIVYMVIRLAQQQKLKRASSSAKKAKKRR